MQVPASMKFDLNGQMPDYLLAKDIILQIIGDIGVAGATYRAMEFGGDAISQVSLVKCCSVLIASRG